MESSIARFWRCVEDLKVWMDCRLPRQPRFCVAGGVVTSYLLHRNCTMRIFRPTASTPHITVRQIS